MTPAERRALVFLSALTLTGAAVRVAGAVRRAPPPPDAAALSALHRQIAAVDTARKKARGRKRLPVRGYSGVDSASAPRRVGRRRRAPSLDESSAGLDETPAGEVGIVPAFPIDMDVAESWQIVALPKVGPTLARRIVADRDSLGPFGSLDELARVKGVGAGVRRAIAPYVTFSLQPRPRHVDASPADAPKGARRRRVREPHAP